MSRTFRNVLAAVVLTTLLIGLPSAYAALKVWSGSESIQVADLNSNFTQVNNSATALVTNAKVSASAAIVSSKLASYRQIPTDWVYMTLGNSTCGTAAANCTETSPTGLSVVGISVGQYRVQFATTRTDTTYGVVIGTESGVVNGACIVSGHTTGEFTLRCYDNATTLTDTGFTATVFDDN